MMPNGEDYRVPPEGPSGEQTPLEPARAPFDEPNPALRPAAAPAAAVAGGQTATEEDRRMAGLAWLSMAIILVPIVSLVLLVAEGNKNRQFQRYHAVNSLVFWIAAVIYETVAGIAFYMLVAVTMGVMLLCLPLYLIFFLPIFVALYYAWQAYQGREVEIPFVSQFARSQRWV